MISRMIAAKIPMRMSVAEFLDWEPGEGLMWQLVDGAPEAISPPKPTHGAIQSELGRLIGNHLLEKQSTCSVLTTPGVIPRVRANYNFRIPDLVVTCSPLLVDEPAVSDPVLVIEVLSPSNQSETWANVWAYTTIPSVSEILVVHTVERKAELLRRLPDSAWPTQPLLIEAGVLTLASIGFETELAAIYRTTRLASAD